MTESRPSTNSLTRIDLDSLENDLNRFRGQLDAWADTIVAKTEAEKTQHVRELRQLAGSYSPRAPSCRRSLPFGALCLPSFALTRPRSLPCR